MAVRQRGRGRILERRRHEGQGRRIELPSAGVGRQAKLGPPGLERGPAVGEDDALGDAGPDRHPDARQPAELGGQYGGELAGLVHQHVRLPRPARRLDSRERRLCIQAGEDLAHDVAVDVALRLAASPGEPRLTQAGRRTGHLEHVEPCGLRHRRGGSARGEGHRPARPPDRLGERQQRTDMARSARGRHQRRMR